VRQVGVTLIEIGSESGTDARELEDAINSRTAAFVWFQGAMTGRGDLPLASAIEIAKNRGIPVMVDAAAQLPPVDNLWRFTREMGADIAIFSGGKDLRGPQASGLILGRKELVAACALNGNPNHSIGRPMKVGKEEIAGLVAAVERYVCLDHSAREQYCEQAVADWRSAIEGIPGVSAERDYPNEAGQPLPRCLITIDPELAKFTRDDVLKMLETGHPIIKAMPSSVRSLHLNPMTLEPGEEAIVRERLVASIDLLSRRNAR
jgi:L-seryl-tRNA(Ser) seleniumtransferase